MFRPISEDLRRTPGDFRNQRPGTINFTFDGRSLSASAGDTVAAALLVNGVASSRETPVSGTKRGPYCLMGVCFDCLVMIDNVGNRQACLIPLREGMVIETQHGPRSVDALEAKRS